MAFKEFVFFLVLLRVASSRNGGMVKGNDLNNLISEKQIEPRIKSIEVSSVVCFIKYEVLAFHYSLRFNLTITRFLQTKHGDIYDCVNIYEQPSLKHPSLKDHTIEVSIFTYFVFNFSLKLKFYYAVLRGCVS